MTLLPRGVCTGLALAALCTGCGGEDDGPPALPPVTAVATAATSTPPAPPSGQPSATATGNSTTSTPPSGARSAERAAVEAAVRYYFDGFRRAYGSGDPKELAKGSTASCSCRRSVQIVKSLLADGGMIMGGSVEVLSLQVNELLGNTATVTVTTNSPDAIRTNTDGSVDTVPGEGRAQQVVLLIQEQGEWKVARIIDI